MYNGGNKMIDFACKQFDLNDVIKCSLNLTKAEYKLLTHLMKNDDIEHTAEDLAKALNLDITTIQRSVKNLHSKNVVLRTQTNLDGGGYVFNYKIKNKELLKNMIKEVIAKWFNKVNDSLEKW